MPQFELQPIVDADLPAMADYLFRATPRFRQDQAEAPMGSLRTVEQYERVLRWRSADNPARVAGASLGVCVRRDDGVVAGVHFFCPWRFQLGDRSLRALVSSSLFVDEAARHTAFFLFKRLLAQPDYDFYCATTCNQSSGQLWAKCGGRPLPGSDGTWIAPIRFAPLVREAMLRRGHRKLAVPASIAGAILDGVNFRTGAGSVRIEPTDDLDFVAETAQRHRCADLMVCQRDLAYLRWMYVAGQAVDRRQIFRFTTTGGQTGWFSASESVGGVDGGIRVARLVDWAIPPPPFDFAALVRAFVRTIGKRSDALVFDSRPDLRMNSKIRFLRRRNYPGPTGYLISKNPELEKLEQLWVASFADRV
jgi:hypothetical protein